MVQCNNGKSGSGEAGSGVGWMAAKDSGAVLNAEWVQCAKLRWGTVLGKMGLVEKGASRRIP